MITHAKRIADSALPGREAGARAVQLKDYRTSTVPVVQRKVYYAKKNVPKPLDKELQPKISAYNNYALSKSNTQIALHKQFELLHAVESTVNTYLKDHTNSITDSERLELFRILRQSENDHIKLTGRLADHGHDIWLGHTNQSQQKQAKTQALWHSLRKSEGNVKIHSKNKDFKNQALSGFSHMLAGDHGRSILKDLNRLRTKGGGHKTDKSKHVYVSDNFLERFRQVAVNKQGDHSSGSWALSLSQIHKGGRDHRIPGTGSGSYVQVENETPSHLDKYNTDKSGKPLHEPKYITLAHELGHARHNLAGTAKSNDSWPNNLNGHPLSGSHNELERKKWTAEEEYNNITQEENPVRSEHGLPVRKFHATKVAQIAHKNKFAIDALFNAMDNAVPDQPQYRTVRQQLGPFSQRIQTGTDMSNTAQVGRLRNDLLKLQQQLPSLMQAAWRRYYLNKAKSWAPYALGLGTLTTGLYGAYNGWFG